MSENEQNQVAAPAEPDQPIKLDYARGRTIYNRETVFKAIKFIAWISVVMAFLLILESIGQFVDDAGIEKMQKIYARYPGLKHIAYIHVGLNILAMPLCFYAGYLLAKMRACAPVFLGWLLIVMGLLDILYPLSQIGYFKQNIAGFNVSDTLIKYLRANISDVLFMWPLPFVFGVFALKSKLVKEAFARFAVTEKAGHDG